MCTESTAPINYAQAVEEFGGNRKLLDDVLSQFLRTTAAELPLLRAAAARGDVAAVEQDAHRIRGAAANLVAGPLAEAARELESLAHGGKLDGAETGVRRIEGEFERLRQFLSAR